MEDSLYVKAGRLEFAGLVQIRSHRQPLAFPQTFEGAVQPKREKSTGVLALMTQMEGELKSDMEAAERDEKTAQSEYEDFMGESASTRAQDAKSITDKEESGAMSTETLEDVSMTINHLHTQCDFLLQNYDARKEARSAEAESLKNGKAVLAGADLGF